MADSGDLKDGDENVEEIVKNYLSGLVDKVVDDVENVEICSEAGEGEVKGHGDWLDQSDDGMELNVEKSEPDSTDDSDQKKDKVKDENDDDDVDLSCVDKAKTEDMIIADDKSMTDVVDETVSVSVEINEEGCQYSLSPALTNVLPMTTPVEPSALNQGEVEDESQTHPKVDQNKTKTDKIKFWKKLKVKMNKGLPENTEIENVNTDLRKDVSTNVDVSSIKKEAGDLGPVAIALQQIIPIATLVVPGDFEVKVIDTTESSLHPESEMDLPATVSEREVILDTKEKSNEIDMADTNPDVTDAIGRKIPKKQILRRWFQTFCKKSPEYEMEESGSAEQIAHTDDDDETLTDGKSAEGYDNVPGDEQTTFGRERFGRIFGCCGGH